MGISEKPVCVIGGASIDIFGTLSAELVAEDSNIGKISRSFGGVGHNIAHNLSKLAIPVELICALGNDNQAEEIRLFCASKGIGLTYSHQTQHNSATYLSVNKKNGDIYVAVADMEINKLLTPAYLRQQLDFLNSCAIVVLETNVSEEACAFIIENVKTRLFVDPVSVSKAGKVKGRLGKIAVLKPNYLEAVELTGKKASPEELVDELLALGVTEVHLTLGDKGVISATAKEKYCLDNYPGNIVNTTGCGDAFLAGIIYGELNGYELLEKSKCGLAAASVTCLARGSISEDLSREKIREIVEDKEWN